MDPSRLGPGTGQLQTSEILVSFSVSCLTEYRIIELSAPQLYCWYLSTYLLYGVRQAVFGMQEQPRKVTGQQRYPGHHVIGTCSLRGICAQLER